MIRYVLICLVAIAAFSTTSCKKTNPCEAIITVRDSTGRPISGATVVLRQDSVVNSNGVRADIFEEGLTAGTGEAFFKVKWEAVLNVEVTYGAYFVKDYIRLEQSETVRKTIIVR